MNIVSSSVDPTLIAMLIRLDGVTFALMSVISVIMIYQTVCAILAKKDERPIILMGFFAALTGWVALDILQIMIARVAIVAGEQAEWFVTTRARLVVPGFAIVLGLAFIAWLSVAHRYVATLTFLLFGVLLFWPEPMIELALAIYRFAAVLHGAS